MYVSKDEFVKFLKIKKFDSFPETPDLYICFKGDYRYDVEVHDDYFGFDIYNHVTGDIVLFINYLPFGTFFI